MKKLYIQPDCQNIQVNVGKSMMAPYSYRGPFGSRGSDLFFWEDEPAGDYNSGRSCRDDFDDEEEDY